jgi:hypothetical protein
MKPSELAAFEALPATLTAFRAHRPRETDWLSYTLSQRVAERFARERGVREVCEYSVDKSDVLALFTRRAEEEVLVLDPAKARRTIVLEVAA